MISLGKSTSLWETKGYATFENPEKLTETEIKTRDRRSIWRILMKEYGLFPILPG